MNFYQQRRTDFNSIFFYHKNGAWTQKDSVKEVSCEIHAIWTRINFPAIELKNVVRKLQQEIANYRDVVRNIKRQSHSQRIRERNFVQSIATLFDISPNDTFDRLDDENNKRFLLDQQKERRSKISELL